MTTEIIPRSLIYDDGEIEIALVNTRGEEEHLHLALRWLAPKPYRGKDGELIETTNLMGGVTEWFIVPFSLAVGIARILVEQRSAGLEGFSSEGFLAMVRWLVDLEEISDCMCY